MLLFERAGGDVGGVRGDPLPSGPQDTLCEGRCCAQLVGVVITCSITWCNITSHMWWKTCRPVLSFESLTRVRQISGMRLYCPTGTCIILMFGDALPE